MNLNPVGCKNNVITRVNVKMKLTSGYSSRHKVDRPRGKCRHGGMMDEFREQDVTGGINKETNNLLYSPHHYLHYQAADLAVKATLDMLFKLFHATINERKNFGEFLGLQSATTLCFVIDTRNSMKREIAALKHFFIKMIQEDKSSARHFVLVPASDPNPNVILSTDDGDKMIRLLNELKAEGGIGEMSMDAAILLAAQNVWPGSTCYVITDTAANDRKLNYTFKSVLLSKKVRIEFKLTTRSKKIRSNRMKRSIEDDYKDIAETSGGTISKVKKSELGVILKSLEEQIGMNIVYVTLAISYKQSTFTFYLDSTMTSVFVHVKTFSAAITAVTLYNPSGEPGKYDNIASVASERTFKITELEIGEWTVNTQLLSSELDYTYIVLCESAIDFTTTLLDPDMLYLENDPIEGIKYDIELQMYGSFKSDSLQVLFVSTGGSIIQEINVNFHSTSYYVQSVLPSEAFYLSVRGQTGGGETFQRIKPKVLKTTFVKLEHTAGVLDLQPGFSTTVTIKLSNMGTSNDIWQIDVYDSKSWLRSYRTISLRVPKHESKKFELTFTAPDIQKLLTSDIILTVVSATDSSIGNSLYLQISMVPQDFGIHTPKESGEEKPEDNGEKKPKENGEEKHQDDNKERSEEHDKDKPPLLNRSNNVAQYKDILLTLCFVKLFEVYHLIGGAGVITYTV